MDVDCVKAPTEPRTAGVGERAKQDTCEYNTKVADGGGSLVEMG
jgi:hypothetical protein